MKKAKDIFKKSSVKVIEDDMDIFGHLPGIKKDFISPCDMVIKANDEDITTNNNIQEFTFKWTEGCGEYGIFKISRFKDSKSILDIFSKNGIFWNDGEDDNKKIIRVFSKAIIRGKLRHILHYELGGCTINNYGVIIEADKIAVKEYVSGTFTSLKPQF